MDDVIPRLNAALEGHYTLLEEIGAGGMAVVVSGATVFPFDVAPDDQRFIMQRLVTTGEAAPRPPMVLIENWAEEVKQKVRALGR